MKPVKASVLILAILLVMNVSVPSLAQKNEAATLNRKASELEDAGKYPDAEPLYKRSLAIYEKALGPNHRDVATALNYLAGLYRHQGRYTDAEPLLKRALAIREKALGPDHPDVAQSLNETTMSSEKRGTRSPKPRKSARLPPGE